jgi:uncharacterized RDD family membrane protein YckC
VNIVANCKKCGNALPEDAKFCPVCGTAVTVEEVHAAPIESTVSAAPELKLAFWWERFVAWLIDEAIVAAALGILGFFTFLVGQPLSLFTSLGLPSWATIFINLSADSIILFVYWTLMEGFYGQSFGKMVMRIKVMRLEGSSSDVERAALAAAGKAFFLFWDVLLGWFLYPRRRQRVFNFLSETVVTKIT